MTDDEMVDCSTEAIRQAAENTKKAATRICEAKSYRDLLAAAEDTIKAIKSLNTRLRNRTTLLEAVVTAFGGAVPLVDPWDDGALATLFKRGTVEGLLK